ncbi:MAG: inositol monophosphatase family protein [Rickettsiales bacterium]
MSNFSANITVLQKVRDKVTNRLRRDYEEISHLQNSIKSTNTFAQMSRDKIEKNIVEELLYARNNFDLLSANMGVIKNDNQKFRWVVNCISDINNFAHALPFSTVSISIEEDVKNEFTTIACMVMVLGANEIFYAEKGKGSWVEISKTHVSNSRIRVSNRSKNLVLVSENEIEQEKVSFNSKIVPLVYLAAGRIDGVFFKEVSHFEISAPVLLINEAGGYVKKKQLKDHYSIFATNHKSDKFLPTLS